MRRKNESPRRTSARLRQGSGEVSPWRVRGRELGGSHIDEDHVETIVQVLVEVPRLHQRPHWDPRRAHDTDTAHDLLEPVEDVQLLVGGQPRQVVEHERRCLGQASEVQAAVRPATSRPVLGDPGAACPRRCASPRDFRRPAHSYAASNRSEDLCGGRAGRILVVVELAKRRRKRCA